MKEITEVTGENLRLVRGSRGMNQDQVAEILGLSGYHISNIEKGRRALSPAEKSLLDLFFFGVIPFDIANEKTMKGVLDFTTDQWRVIEILARRESTTPGKWIAAQVRAYLNFDEEARKEASRIIAERKAENSSDLYAMDDIAKVAEEPPSAGNG